MEMNPSPTPPEKAHDPSTEQSLRRSLLGVALFILLAPCGLCWLSSQVEQVELVLIPGAVGLLAVGFSLYTFYRQSQNQDLAPPLWEAVLILLALAGALGLALAWLLESAGWRNGAGSAILALGAWTLFLAGRRVWAAWTFSRDCQEEENDLATLEMVPIRGSHPIYPLLVYRYAGEYRGQLQNDKIYRETGKIRQAIEEGRFRVTVQYLPDDPRVHRLKGWRILQ